MKVVIINGLPGSGKSTFVRLCKELSGQHESLRAAYEVSTVDEIKRVAQLMGYLGDDFKTPKSRKFLSDLKMAHTAFNNGPFHYAKKMIMEYSRLDEGCCVFIHCRELDEIKAFKRTYMDGGITLKIASRGSSAASNFGDSEAGRPYNYDYIVENNGTLEDLKDKALEFMRAL